MARNRLKAKGRREAGSFAQIPDSVLRSPECLGVSHSAFRLLIALAAQYNGHNNGNLSAAKSIMRDYGIGSSDTLSNGIAGLLEAGLVIRTRSHCRTRDGRRCALFALAWKPINECPGKGLEVAPTVTAPRTFRAVTLQNTWSENRTT